MLAPVRRSPDGWLAWVVGGFMLIALYGAFIYAPRELKVRRVMALGKSEGEATELVDTVDAERAAFSKQYFDEEWPSRYLYHLWVNSAMGEAVAAETILQAMKAHEQSL